MHEIWALALGTNYQSYVSNGKTINGSTCRHYHQDVLDISFSGINKIICVSSIVSPLKNKYPEFYHIRPKSSDAGLKRKIQHG
jgi:hypothetical protein